MVGNCCLAGCIDSLKPENHPQDHLINIVTGRIAPTTVNADSPVSIGEQLMKQYEAGWPESFHKPISKPVVTMSVSKKRVNIDSVAVFDTSLIYSQVLCLKKIRNIDMKEVLHHELAGVPPSMFDESDDMCIATSKSTLKSIPQVQLAHRRWAHRP